MAEITICSDFGAQKNKVYGNLLKLIPYNYTKRGLFFSQLEMPLVQRGAGLHQIF